MTGLRPVLTGLSARAGRRALLRHPVQLLLAVLGVAAGVAVVVAVDLANQSARQAMAVSLETVAGRASHQVRAGARPLPAQLYASLRTELGLARAAPVMEGGVTLPAAGDRPLILLGLDPFAEGPFRGYLDAGSSAGDDGLGGLVAGAGQVVLPAEEARALSLAAGDTLELTTATGRHRVSVAGIVTLPDRDLSGLLFADIATADVLLGRGGALDRIDLMLDPEQVHAVRSRLPPDAALTATAAREGALQEMSRAFRVNLTALGLLALVVGLFLVFNTLSFLVVQRRALLGTLRALGVTRRQVLVQVLGDAALVGLAGTVLGLAAGVPLAAGLVELVLRTIDDLYFATQVRALTLDPWSLAKGAALGLGGSLAAALAPAREAAAVAPRAAQSRADLERRSRRAAARAALLGLAVLAGGALALAAGGDGLVTGFAGLFAVIVGAALLVPWATDVLCRAARPAARGVIPRLALRGVSASLSRTGVAVASLAVAVSAVVGVAVMIGSFRTSVEDWLDRSLASDFYLSGPDSAPGAVVDDALAERIAGLDGVAAVTRSRWHRQPTGGDYRNVWALDLPADGWQRFRFQAGDPARAEAAFRAGEGVLVSEPLAYREGLAVGGPVRLPTARGEAALPVAGIIRDYGSTRGMVILSLARYRQLYDDRRLTSLGIHLALRADRAAVAEQIQGLLAGRPGAQLQDNAVIRERSLEVFDRTFAITEVLRLLAAGVAFVGVFGALMALQLDRAREHAVLRALGLTRGGLGALVAGQSGVLGLAAGLLALPLGLALAWLLVFVINRRAFGWTMAFEVQAAPLLEGVALAVVAALLAGIYPAWRAARGLPAAGLREE